MRNFLSVMTAIAALYAVPAAAQDNDQRWCSDTWKFERFDISMVRDITLMRATEAPKTFLLDRNGYKLGCPQKGAACRNGYVLPGQVVLVVGKTSGDYLCAVFPNKRGGSEGWISRAALQPLAARPPKAASLQSWAGHWTTDKDHAIDIKVEGKMLAASGEALWFDHGLGSVNDGEFQAQAVPQDGRALFSQGDEKEDCRVGAKVFGDYLLVSDNRNCGGLNVSFYGIYQREKR